MHRQASPTRRRVIALSAGLAGAAILPLPGLATTGAAPPRRLVVVLLRGAVDGLNIVVPYRDEAYYAARPSIAIGRPSEPGGGLALDTEFALHPALAGLLPLWEHKQLAFVHAAGLQEPTRSHFDAQLFIENGTPGRRGTPDGWMNRLLAALPASPGGARSPTEALAVGPTMPQIMRGRMAVANLPLAVPMRPSALDKPEVASGFDRLYAGDGVQGRAYRQGRAARADLAAGLSPAMEGADNGAPPPTGLPAQAVRLARLMAREPRIRLVFLGYGGWDTHVRQNAQLTERLKPLGDGLAALAQGLGEAWNDTLVVVLSEFGRTLRENGDGGTDHGHGNVMWLLGGGVRGGRVYGEWPGLGAAQLWEGRDLAVTTDYRHVLAVAAERHLRLADRQLGLIFPGLPSARGNLGQLFAA